MTATVFDEGNALISIVNGVAGLGIDVPDQVHAEARLYQSLRPAQKSAETAHADALSRLRLAPLEEFDAAREDVITASLSLFAIASGVDRQVLEVSTRRLQAVVYDSIGDWETAVVDRFNGVVDRDELNSAAGYLPNLADPGSYNVLSLTEAQGRAVSAWVAATNELRPLWRVYTNLARFNGHTIGPAGADDLSANLFTACILGNPGTYGRADNAATIMASASFRSDATSRYGQLIPFVIPALSGYDLRLSTPDQASARRRQIQPGS